MGAHGKRSGEILVPNSIKRAFLCDYVGDQLILKHGDLVLKH